LLAAALVLLPLLGVAWPCWPLLLVALVLATLLAVLLPLVAVLLQVALALLPLAAVHLPLARGCLPAVAGGGPATHYVASLYCASRSTLGFVRLLLRLRSNLVVPPRVPPVLLRAGTGRGKLRWRACAGGLLRRRSRRR
jgi:hypothetical protein